MTTPTPTTIRHRFIHSRALILGGTVVVTGVLLNLFVLSVVSGGGSNAAPVTEPPVATAPLETAPAPQPVADATELGEPAVVAETSVPPDASLPPALVVQGELIAGSGAPTGQISGTMTEAVQPVQPAAPSAVVPTPATPSPVAPPPAVTKSTSTKTTSTKTTTPKPVSTTPRSTTPATTSPAAKTPSSSSPATTAPASTSTTAPASTSTTQPPSTTTAPQPASTVEYPEYQASSGAGRIVLTYTDGSAITLYGFYPNSGWVYEVESNGPRTVKLKFFNVNTGRDAEWKATIEGGRIQIEN